MLVFFTPVRPIAHACSRPTILPHTMSWTCLGCVDLREPPMFGDHGRKISLGDGGQEQYAMLVPDAPVTATAW